MRTEPRHLPTKNIIWEWSLPFVKGALSVMAVKLILFIMRIKSPCSLWNWRNYL